MIKGFQDFLNESENQRVLERALDMVIYHGLGAFSPDGGNSTINYWNFSDFKSFTSHDPLFGDNGPDIWVNCGDFNGEIINPLRIVVDYYRSSVGAKKVVKEAFQKYGMIVQELDLEEVILELDLPYHQKTPNSEYKRGNREAVVKFYKETQPDGLKELKEKLGRGYIEGTRIGLI